MNLVFFRYFAKLNLAIILLLVIAGFSILGTIIEQNQTIEYYKLNYIDNSKIFDDKVARFSNQAEDRSGFSRSQRGRWQRPRRSGWTKI